MDVELCDSTQAAQQVDELKHNINSESPTGKLPSMDNYPGPYDFEILLEEASNKRSWVVSTVTLLITLVTVTVCVLSLIHI